MNSGRTLFAQLMDFLPLHEFRKCVRRYRGEYKMKTFSCFDQFLCLAFAQLTGRDRLRDIEICLRPFQTRLYHAGFRGSVSRNNLSHANRVRPWKSSRISRRFSFAGPVDFIMATALAST